QGLVELLAPDLEPGRQAERRPELLRRLVDGEPWPVGRDLEEDAAGLAVVDRLEVPAVDHRGDVAAGPQQQLAPALLRVRVLRAPRDVVDRAGRFPALGAFGRFDDVDDGVRSAGAGGEARAVGFLAALTKAHGAGEEVQGRGRLGDGEGHRVEAADRVVFADRRLGPRLPAIVRRLADELERDAVGVAERYGVGVEPADPAVLDPELAQPAAPPVERGGRHRERDGRDLPAPHLLLRPGRPAEEGHRGAWRAQVVAKVDVV